MIKVAEDGLQEEAGDMRLTLDELAREGARRMLLKALEAEVAANVEPGSLEGVTREVAQGLGDEVAVHQVSINT